MIEDGRSRRHFLLGAAGVGAALLLRPSLARAVLIDAKAADLVNATIGIDTHNHIDVPLSSDQLAPMDLDIGKDLRRSGLSAICMTFAVDYQKLTQPNEAYMRFLEGMANMDELLRRAYVKRALTLADITAAHQATQPIVIQSIEGAHFLEGNLARVEEAHGRGLRMFGMLHDNDAAPPLGDVYTNPPHLGGLTPLGAEVIKECNRLGILVDLAHADAATTAAALKVARKPMIISHTGLDTRLGSHPDIAAMMRPRLIGKDQARAVAAAGGAIGVWTHLSDTPEEYVDNLRAMIDVVGIDHVCIGTDTKLTPPLRMPRGADDEPGPRSSVHLEGGFGGGGGGPPGGGAGGPPGGGAGGPPGGGGGFGGPPGGGGGGGFGIGVGTGPSGRDRDKQGGYGAGPGNGRGGDQEVGERTNQVWASQTAGFYYTVVAAMMAAGFSAGDIGKVGGGNFLRIFGAAVG